MNPQPTHPFKAAHAHADLCVTCGSLRTHDIHSQPELTIEVKPGVEPVSAPRMVEELHRAAAAPRRA